MDLIQVDVVQPEALERCVDRRQDMLASEPASVLARHRLPVHLRREHVLLAREEIAEHAAAEPFALATVVDVGGVEERDPAFDRVADDGLGLVLGERPRALGVLPEAHHPEAHARHAEPGLSQIYVPHDRSESRKTSSVDVPIPLRCDATVLSSDAWLRRDQTRFALRPEKVRPSETRLEAR